MKSTKTAARKSGNRNPHAGKTMAQRADRHVLYEKSVQDAGAEYKFVSKTFRKLRGRRAERLREDFCGTANMCCEWVRRNRKNTAIGVDIDPQVLAWGRKHKLSRLKPAARMRLTLLQEDVCQVQTPPVDVVLAMNFSFQLFKERKVLGAYFSSVRDSLVDDGVLFLDLYGGYEAFQELKEKRKYKGFKYIWDQERYNPITGDMRCHIHFAFPDGSRLKRAFTYDWRLWTLPEVRELLDEAGYSRVTVYWEGADKETGEGNGKFKPATVGEADPGWIVFITAEK
jgi:cyclopropane fatty-acyl-phospholipid synthase-like methyltransferase